MELILDTCALLSISGISRKKLKPKTGERLATASRLTISACSLYEIALKNARGSLKLGSYSSAKAFWDEAVSTYLLEVLPVTDADFYQAVQLPEHHPDPLDRIIIYQAMRLGCTIVTYDSQFEGYGLKLLW